MFLREGKEGRVVGFEVADEGAVGLDDDVLGGTVGYYGALLAPGVELCGGEVSLVWVDGWVGWEWVALV